MPSPDLILRNPLIERNLLEYVLLVTSSSSNWWGETIQGTALSRSDQFSQWRKRYDARRSVAQLDQDAKNTPYPRAANVGVGMEAIFGEFLIPTLLGNTHDLEPACQAIDEGTEQVVEDLTIFHDKYHKSEELGKRDLLEESTREILTVGGVIHKWTWGSVWKHNEVPLNLFVHPMTNQPVMLPNQQTGQPEPMPADPKMPQELYPTDPQTGMKLKVKKVPAVNIDLQREGPQLNIRPYENIQFPPGAKTVDPETWDWIADTFQVSPWWFLGKEGDPFEGKLQNLDLLWKFLRIDPNTIYMRPDARLNQPVNLLEWHGKYPVTSSGKPVEVIALIATEARLLLGWRVSPFSRRPFFNRQVWSRGQHPFGKGIPETVYGLRNAVDANLNQDIDAGNLYNQPPLLLSTLAMAEDEDYESVGPGTQWIVQDINGVKFLAPPIGKRDPITMMNWLIGMMQRIWGVTDFATGAPTESLSPNISTARGAELVHSQGNIKFGHLTRKIATTDTKEYQYVHDMFRTMLANPKTISIKGKPMTVQPSNREEFFRKDVRIVAVGNGVTTNPQLRHRSLQEFLMLMMKTQNPFIAGDLEVLKDLTEQIISSTGIKLTLKEPQVLQQMKLLQELMQTPNGAQNIQQAAQVTIQQLQQMQQAQAMGGGKTTVTQGGNGVQPSQRPANPF